MNSSADQSQMTEQVRDLLDQWTAGLSDVVASMADQKPEVHWEASGAPPG